SPLRNDHWDWVDVQSLHPFADDGRERFVQVSRLGYGDRHPDEPETRYHLLLLEGGKGSRIFGTVHDADAVNSGVDLLEQLQVLFVYGFRLVHNAGDLPPGRASDSMKPRPIVTR